MDRETQNEINRLVEKFRWSNESAWKQQVIDEAETTFGEQPEAFASFVGEVLSGLEEELPPETTTTTTLPEGRVSEERAQQNEFDRLVAMHGWSDSPAWRQQVVQQAEGVLGAGSERMSDFVLAVSDNMSAPLPPEAPAAGMPAEESVGMGQESSGGRRATSGKTIPPDTGETATAPQPTGFDIGRLSVFLQMAQYATQLGMPQDLASRVARYNVDNNVTFEQFQSDLDADISQGYEQQTINEIYEAKLEGIEFMLPERRSLGQATKPRLVVVEREGEESRPQMSQQPGIASREDGYRIMRNPDGSRFLYDSTNPEVYLEELSAEARNELALWMYTRGMVDNPQNYQSLIMGTAQLLESANQFGRDLRWTMDTMDEVTGFNMDRYYNRLSGPTVVYDREEAMNQANALASEQLGRALTRSEQLAVVDAFNRRTIEYQRAAAEAAMRADVGEQVTLQQAPSLESMTTRWLETMKPNEVRQAQEYVVGGSLRQLALEGKLGAQR